MPVSGSSILRLLAPVCLFVGAWLATPWASAINIEIRLMCQTTGGCGPGDFFFDHPQALPALEFAVRAFKPFTDSLSAIPSSPSWSATFTNPDTGTPGFSLSNLSVPANTLLLYAGGWDMPSNQVGSAGPGTASISLSRGQGTIIGPAANDFATWGGSIAFDTLNNGSPRNWHFDPYTLPGPGRIDFLTIAFHELAHVFGFGTAPSFDNLIQNHQFLGAHVIALNGGAAQLALDDNHWAVGTTSGPYAVQRPSALTAALLQGQRTPLTPIDYAALADLGWQVPSRLLGLHGDANQDGRVDGRDFLLWQQGFGSNGSLIADMNGDWLVDDFDLWMWRNNYGVTIAPGAMAASIQVPEPSVIALGFIATLTIACRVSSKIRSFFEPPLC